VLAIGDVKGFAFTLGMSTVLDLVVVFLFTHPLMAVLSRYRWFGSGRISGLGQVDKSGRSTAPRVHQELATATAGAPAQNRSTS
jgi:preprotein translocase subunit SecD